MMDHFVSLRARAEEIHLWLIEELSHVRTGRANPSIVEKITISAHGASTPIPHAASIVSEDARTIKITPWDKSNISLIQSAIDRANLGVSTAPDETGIRVIFPELTGETREKMVKLAKEKLEKAKVSLRQAREDAWNDIVQKERDGAINKDGKFRLKDEMQKIIDDMTTKFLELETKKEKEVLNQ